MTDHLELPDRTTELTLKKARMEAVIRRVGREGGSRDGGE